MTAGREKQTGFTLIEVLVAMVVLGILASSMVYILKSQSGTSARSTEMVRGFGYAKQKLDSLKVAGYDNLTSGSDTVDANFLCSWYITAGQDELGVFDGRKTIELSVYWPLTGEHGVALASLVSDDRFKENP